MSRCRLIFSELSPSNNDVLLVVFNFSAHNWTEIRFYSKKYFIRLYVEGFFFFIKSLVVLFLADWLKDFCIIAITACSHISKMWWWESVLKYFFKNEDLSLSHITLTCSNVPVLVSGYFTAVLVGGCWVVRREKGHWLKWVTVYSLTFYGLSLHSTQKGVCVSF